jgi:methyl-accepting chemotaxis protein
MAVQGDVEGEDMLAEWSRDLEAVLYEQEVEEAIREVCPTSDPLDSKDFDPIDYINQLFPTEQSLAGIDDTMTRMKVKVQGLDEEIRTIVRGQADMGHDGRQALEEAHRTIEELFGRIKNIKEKAEHSEHMVKKITSDIKQLDNAKRHLTDSVRTLERLRFLITCLEDLQ